MFVWAVGYARYKLTRPSVTSPNVADEENAQWAERVRETEAAKEEAKRKEKIAAEEYRKHAECVVSLKRNVAELEEKLTVTLEKLDISRQTLVRFRYY
ncbi:unnamed protein product [Gongylonema pulchrum]|uniref:Myosin_tail_1 domain-containing protein n=1 Tax=Gongylonema pulchrum TaxID=637853 RepID=A0A183E4V6_9BILA|nr:unnamed protein product [Gongylonema pulchrum]